MKGDLLGSQCSKYRLCRRWVKVASDDSYTTWETRVGSWSWCIESFFYVGYSAILIVLDSDTISCVDSLSICTHLKWWMWWFFAWSWGKSIFLLIIPVWDADIDSFFLVFLWEESAIGRKVVHRTVDTRENQESKDCWEPLTTMRRSMSVNRMFHTYLQKEQNNYSI